MSLIAIDGPAGSGKATLAARLAEHLQYPWLDTGVLYRAVAMQVRSHVGQHDFINLAIEAAHGLRLEDIAVVNRADRQLGNLAAKIAVISEVRRELLQFQRTFGRQRPGAILVGRDIGTVVCPHAEVKIYLTASIEARAARWTRKMQRYVGAVDGALILSELTQRDALDALRLDDAFAPASSAYRLDTTALADDEVFQRVSERVQSATAAPLLH